MDSNMLFEAAREGRTEVLERLLQENRPIRADIRLTSLGESVLHVATKFEQVNFVNELMKIDPDIAREMNKDGFRPLDISVLMGNLAIVRNILSFDRDLGRLGGKDNRTALHYAAVKGRVDIIDELLSTCPDGIEDITVHGETALHLAVKHYQFNAFVELVRRLERLNKETIINVQDGDGNTVLHLAVSTKQYACLNVLLDKNYLRGTIELNVPNGKGLTALDISDNVLQDSYDAKVRELLQLSGAISAQHSTTITTQHSPQHKTNPQPIQHPDQHLQSESASRNWYNYFHFQMERDSPGETRNAILVVAALIATVTFQAGVTPPQGLFEKITNTHVSWYKSYVNYMPYLFLFFNSLGFMGSRIILFYLTLGFPLYMELAVSLFSLWCTYSCAITITGKKATVESTAFQTVFYIANFAFGIAVAWRLLPWFQNRSKWQNRSARGAEDEISVDVRK